MDCNNVITFNDADLIVAKISIATQGSLSDVISSLSNAIDPKYFKPLDVCPAGSCDADSTNCKLINAGISCILPSGTTFFGYPAGSVNNNLLIPASSSSNGPPNCSYPFSFTGQFMDGYHCNLTPNPKFGDYPTPPGGSFIWSRPGTWYRAPIDKNVNLNYTAGSPPGGAIITDPPATLADFVQAPWRIQEANSPVGKNGAFSMLTYINDGSNSILQRMRSNLNKIFAGEMNQLNTSIPPNGLDYYSKLLSAEYFAPGDIQITVEEDGKKYAYILLTPTGINVYVILGSSPLYWTKICTQTNTKQVINLVPSVFRTASPSCTYIKNCVCETSTDPVCKGISPSSPSGPKKGLLLIIGVSSAAFILILLLILVLVYSLQS